MIVRERKRERERERERELERLTSGGIVIVEDTVDAHQTIR